MTRLSRILVATCVGLAVSASSLVSVADAAPSSGTLTSSYTVRAGDYLSGIAFKLNVNLRDLLAANDMTTTSLILPGQVLKVPVRTSSAGAGSTGATPAPNAAPVTTAARANGTTYYTVVSGDFLTGIAAKLGVTTRSLLSANGLQINSLIHPGMRLVVPAGGRLPSTPASTSAPATTTTAPTAATARYTVVAGDSLSGIAAKLKVTLRSLLATNQLTVSSLIHPGMTLVVPAGGRLPAATPAPTTTTPTTTSSVPPTTAPSAPAAGAGNAKVPAALQPVISFARAQLGKPYKRFAVGPDSYDCSGLTMAAYATIGMSLPHYSGAQISFGTVVDWTTEPIKPGDLIFMETAPGSGVIGHVGLATSGTTWIQAPRTGDVVREGTFNTTRIVGVRRLVNG